MSVFTEEVKCSNCRFHAINTVSHLCSFEPKTIVIPEDNLACSHYLPDLPEDAKENRGYIVYNWDKDTPDVAQLVDGTLVKCDPGVKVPNVRQRIPMG